MSDETKINPYTGLPDKLFDTFSEIKVIEHPIVAEEIDTAMGSRHQFPRPVEIPEGWELIHITSTDRPVIVRSHPLNNYGRVQPGGGSSIATKVLTIPVYILGRRRDGAMEALREKIRSEEIRASCLQRELEKAACEASDKQRVIEKLEKSLETARTSAHNSYKAELKAQAELRELKR